MHIKKIQLIIAFFSLFSHVLVAQESQPKKQDEEIESEEKDSIGAAVDEAKKSRIFKDQFTTIQNPFELRDPFRRKSFRRGKKIGLGKDFAYSNIPEIQSFTIDQLQIVGIFFGQERRAVGRIGESKDTFILKEGMKVGESNAEIKAIMPGGIVLVEKIRNVYDQEEILETIIPLSSPQI